MIAARLAGALVLLLGACPAIAQLSAQAAVSSEYRLRGYSLSRARPVASASLGYDDKSGLFVDATGIVTLASGERVRWLGGIATIGYAGRLHGNLSFDLGLLRAQFSPYARLDRPAGYTEIFAGISGRALSAHLSLSPDYFTPGNVTLTTSLDGALKLPGAWRLIGHAGTVSYLRGGPPAPISKTQYNWSGGIVRPLGKLELELVLNGGGPDPDYYSLRTHSKTRLVGTARMNF